MKSCSPWEELTLEKYVEDSPVERTSCWCRRKISLPEEEAAAETACDELTLMSIPCLSVLQRGRRQRIGNKVKTGKKLIRVSGSVSLGFV